MNYIQTLNTCPYECSGLSVRPYVLPAAAQPLHGVAYERTYDVLIHSTRSIGVGCG